MSNKEIFIKNPMRSMKPHTSHEPYVPEYQRLIAEGKITGVPKESDLTEHQSQLRQQIIKDLQMAPKVMIPSVGHQDIGWNKNASFYDEPLSNTPVYDDNLVREDLTSDELDKIHEKISTEQVKTSLKNKDIQEPVEKNEYKPPTSLDQLNNNEIIIILKGQVIFSSLDELDIKNKLASLIFEENHNPETILVIKRLPISISINLS